MADLDKSKKEVKIRVSVEREELDRLMRDMNNVINWQMKFMTR